MMQEYFIFLFLAGAWTFFSMSSTASFSKVANHISAALRNPPAKQINFWILDPQSDTHSITFRARKMLHQHASI